MSIPLGLPGDIFEPLGRLPAATAVHGALEMEVCHSVSLRCHFPALPWVSGEIPLSRQSQISAQR